MKENLTELIVAIDKSGSMGPMQNAAIEGFNAFLQSQKEAPGEAKMTVVLFDTSFSFYAANVDVNTVKPLDTESYSPGGGTALYDALCTTIDDIGKKLSATAEKDRPSKVIFAILTDGEENSSRKFTRAATFDRIAKQRDTYSWDFIFLAANEDGMRAGESIGMQMNKMAMFSNDSKGHTSSYAAISNYTSLARSMNMAAYTAMSATFDTQGEVDALTADKESTTGIDTSKKSTAKV